MIEVPIELVCWNCGGQLTGEVDRLHFKTRVKVHPCARGCFGNYGPDAFVEEKETEEDFGDL